MSGVLAQVAPPTVSVTPCWITGLGLWITGTPVLTGGAAATGLVAAAFAVPDPQGLAAVTTTVTENPLSAAVSTYVSAVAPEIARQSAPLQRSHWYSKRVGASVHVPVSARRVRPRIAVPLTTGATRERGTGRVWIDSGSLCAVALCPDVAAATTSTIAWPASSALRAYSDPPPTEAQLERPSASQRRQSSVSSADGKVQRPESPLSVSPT